MNNSNLKIQVSRYILDESAKTLGKLVNANKKLIDDQLVVTGKTFENILSLARKVNKILDNSDKGLRTIFYNYGDNKNENDFSIENEHLIKFVKSKLNQQKSNKFDIICKQKWVVHTINYSAYAKFKTDVLDNFVRILNEEYPLDKYIEPLLKREKKIKIVDPTEFCFILYQLNDYGYIKLPTHPNGDNDLDSLVKALKKTFNISVSDGSIKTYLGSSRIEDMKTKFDEMIKNSDKESNLIIPRKKKNK